MPQMHCNFFSYSLGHGVDLTITLPGVSPCDMDDPALLTHQMPEKFPVLYLLHGHGNDYLSWERFTCVSRYAEEYRIAVVSVSVGNTLYMDTIYGEKYYEFIGKEVPEFVNVLSIYICPLGAGLAGIMLFWVCGKEYVEKQVNKGRSSHLTSWFYPICKYVYVPVCILVLILGIALGGIG